MILGYILIAAFAGMFSSITALILGASFWFAFSLYVFIGCSVLILLPVTQTVAVSLGRSSAIASASIFHKQ